MTEIWANCLLLVISVDSLLKSSSAIATNTSSTLENIPNFGHSTMEVPNVYDDLKVHSTFGILHTLARYTEWAVKEESIFKVLSQRQKLVREELAILQRYLKDYTDTLDKDQIRGHNFKGPSGERVKETESKAKLKHDSVRRYVTEGYKLRRFMMSPEFNENQKDVQAELELEDRETWMLAEFVGWDDLYMSLNSFLHLREIYGFKADKMTGGLRLDTLVGGSLDALHTAELGVFTMYRENPTLSIEWFELTHKILWEGFTDVVVGISLDVMSLFIAVAIQEHNLALERMHEDKDNISPPLGLYLVPITPNVPPEHRVSFRYRVFADLRGLGESTSNIAQFMDLCLENTHQTPETQGHLKCFYERKRHPYLYINPVKVEQLSESPRILQFYEMVGNETIEKVKRDYENILALSRIIGQDGVEKVTERRTSVGTFLPVDDAHLEGSYNLAEAVSGLRIRGTAEQIQFVEYTYGRYYVQHRDALSAGEENDSIRLMGNRLATMLYYLEIPVVGGLTPFCQVGVSARPVRGSAILWYGLYRNGTAREDVEHGSCPVVHGHKIIMNHWIRYYGNWKTFSCSLNQFD